MGVVSGGLAHRKTGWEARGLLLLPRTVVQSKWHQQRGNRCLSLVPSQSQLPLRLHFPSTLGKGICKTRYGWEFSFLDTIVIGEYEQFPSHTPGQFPQHQWQTPVPDASA